MTPFEDMLSETLKTYPITEPAYSATPLAIETAARKRCWRRRTSVGAAGVAVPAVVAGGLVVGNRPAHDAHTSTSPVVRPPRFSPLPPPSTDGGLGLRPACPPFWIDVTDVSGASSVSPPNDDTQETTVVTQVGAPLQVTMQIVPNPSQYVVLAQAVVVDASIQAEAPSGPAEDPANQFAASETLGGFVADGQQLTISWTPEEPGHYSVMEVTRSHTNDECSAPPPTEGMLTSGEGEIASITVE
jgi:hypothetical protein